LQDYYDSKKTNAVVERPASLPTGRQGFGNLAGHFWALL